MSYHIPTLHEVGDISRLNAQYIMMLKDDPEMTEEYMKSRNLYVQQDLMKIPKPKVPWTQWKAPKIKDKIVSPDSYL